MGFQPKRIVGLTIALALVHAYAWADMKSECVEASYAAQQERVAGKLVEARAALLVCGRVECPPVIQADCSKWLGEVDESLPTVVFGARDRSGRDVLRVRVFLDEVRVADELLGKAVSVDPGPHALRFEMDGEESISDQFVAREGEKNRALFVDFRGRRTGDGAPAPVSPQAEPPPTPIDRPAPSLRSESPVPLFAAYALEGIGAVSLVASVALGLQGKGDVDRLRATCAPGCKQPDIDAARSKLFAADVLLVTGIAAVAIGGGVFLVRSLTGSTGKTAWLPSPVMSF
jgi:hypothetical protein